ncbi:MAG: type II toxin-antitoxin system VapC family toxin [Burkholderiaceae bacterium]
MGLVVDASVVLAWLLPDERSDAAQGIVEALAHEPAQAPGLLGLEVANALTQAGRRARIPVALQRELLDAYLALPIALDPTDGHAVARCAELARRHALSAYDAAYLELAARRRFALATFDTALARAARKEGIALVAGA